MPVNKIPYREWERQRRYGDYRNTDTQITTFVRQQLSGDDYLRNSNRVNQGPNRNKRVNQAKSSPIIPHVFGSKDMWGWREWANSLGKDFIVYGDTGLIELEGVIPGTSYLAYNLVGGASVIEENLYSTESISLSYEPASDISITTPTSSINNIPIDPSGLSQISDNYLMVYNPSFNKFEFKSPSIVLGLADGDNNSESINFGSY